MNSNDKFNQDFTPFGKNGPEHFDQLTLEAYDARLITELGGTPKRIPSEVEARKEAAALAEREIERALAVLAFRRDQMNERQTRELLSIYGK